MVKIKLQQTTSGFLMPQSFVITLMKRSQIPRGYNDVLTVNITTFIIHKSKGSSNHSHQKKQPRSSSHTTRSRSKVNMPNHSQFSCNFIQPICSLKHSTKYFSSEVSVQPYLKRLQMTEPSSNSYPEFNSSKAMTEASPKLGGLRPTSLNVSRKQLPCVLQQQQTCVKTKWMLYSTMRQQD